MDPRTGTTRRRIGCAVLFVVVLLLPLPSTQGQAATQLFIADQDTSYGWTFSDTQLARGTLVDDDADMSVGTFFGATPPVPPPISRAVEITALHIDEIDPALLRLRLEVAELDATALQREQTLFGISYAIGFTMEGHQYTAVGQLSTSCTAPEDTTCGNLAAAGILFTPQLSRSAVDQGGSTSLGLAPSRVLEDQNAVEILVPRHLTRTDGHGHPGAHSVVHTVWAESWTSHAIFDRWQDDVRSDNAVPFLRLTGDAYGSQVVVSSQPPREDKDEVEPSFGRINRAPIEPRRERVDIPEQMPARVPLYLTNVLERKIIVIPEVTVASGGSGHTVHAPEGLEIAAGATRRIDLVVNSTGAIEPDQPLVLTVDAIPLGLSTSTGDRLDVLVRSVPRLAPDAPRLYMHATEPQAALWVGPMTVGGFYDGALSTLAAEPTMPANEAFLASNCLCPSTFVWRSTAPLAAPVVLDLTRDGNLHLEIDAPSAGTYRVSVVVVYAGTPIGSGQVGVDLDAGETKVDVPVLFTADDPRLEPGDMLELDINARFSMLPNGISAFTTEQDAPRVRLQGLSHLEFPLNDAPLQIQGADHLVVDTGAGYDAYQYVNPGRTTLWNVTVLNQGTANDTVTLEAEADDTDWAVRIAPGKAYRIGPGQSITVGVLATAPRDAREESHLMVNLTATSKIADGRGTTLTLRAIVTTGVQIPDVIFTADNETHARVADVETKDSPSAPFLAALAALGLVVAARRRRV